MHNERFDGLIVFHFFKLGQFNSNSRRAKYQKKIKSKSSRIRENNFYFPIHPYRLLIEKNQIFL